MTYTKYFVAYGSQCSCNMCDHILPRYFSVITYGEYRVTKTITEHSMIFIFTDIFTGFNAKLNAYSNFKNDITYEKTMILLKIRYQGKSHNFEF